MSSLPCGGTAGPPCYHSTMPDSDWLAAARRALTAHPVPAAPWSDMDFELYFREGFTPEGAAAELALLEAARS